MQFGERIRQLIDKPVLRKHAPAVGSIVVHGLAGVAIAGMIAASAKPMPAVPDTKPEPALEVSLVADLPVPESPSVRPPPGPRVPAPRPATRDASPVDAPAVSPPRKPPKQSNTTPQPEKAAGATDIDTGVYLGPTPLTGPRGLQGLAQGDPCKPAAGVKPKDCATDWAARVGSEPSRMLASKEEKKRYYAEFMPTCPWKVGCEPGDGVLLNGARSFGLKSPMASGAGSLQGIHDLVGRLPQVPDFVDPGFGD